MRGSEFVFNYVHLFYYKYHKIDPNRGGSHIDSPDWIKYKRTTINVTNKKNNKCSQYSVKVALSHSQIGKNPERITRIKPFINKYNWKKINFLSKKDDWKKIEKNNLAIANNILYAKKEKAYPAFISKHNSNREKQVNILMSPNGEGWHYLALKNCQHY